MNDHVIFQSYPPPGAWVNRQPRKRIVSRRRPNPRAEATTPAPERARRGAGAARLTSAVGTVLPALPAAAPPFFAGDDADPDLCCPPRLSFVDDGDSGARDRGLWPGTPILVAPCDRFVGAGYYQLVVDGRTVIGHAFRINAEGIRVAQMLRAGGHIFVDLTHEMFDDAVLGLVVASLDVVCPRLATELHRQHHVRG